MSKRIHGQCSWLRLVVRDEPQVIFRFSMETFLSELMNLSSQVCRAWCFKQFFFCAKLLFFDMSASRSRSPRACESPQCSRSVASWLVCKTKVCNIICEPLSLLWNFWCWLVVENRHQQNTFFEAYSRFIQFSPLSRALVYQSSYKWLRLCL